MHRHRKSKSGRLEKLVIAINANLGGPPSAAAMAISAGWPRLVLPGILIGILVGILIGILTGILIGILPGILIGIWGYVIGTPVGILIVEWCLR